MSSTTISSSSTPYPPLLLLPPTTTSYSYYHHLPPHTQPINQSINPNQISPPDSPGVPPPSKLGDPWLAQLTGLLVVITRPCLVKVNPLGGLATYFWSWRPAFEPVCRNQLVTSRSTWSGFHRILGSLGAYYARERGADFAYFPVLNGGIIMRPHPDLAAKSSRHRRMCAGLRPVIVPRFSNLFRTPF